MNNHTTHQKYWVIIVAAGSGKRFNHKIPKQYLTLNHLTVIEHSIGLFIDNPLFDKIIVVLAKDDTFWKKTRYAQHEKISVVVGGSERYQSVNNALQYIAQSAGENDWLLVHDAVRPCVKQADINALLDSLDKEQVGALLACPVNDTLKQCTDYKVQTTLSRQNLWRALTPQVFRYGLLTKALQHSIDNKLEITDEAAAIEALDLQPSIVEGDSSNIKITYPADLKLAELLLQEKR